MNNHVSWDYLGNRSPENLEHIVVNGYMTGPLIQEFFGIKYTTYFRITPDPKDHDAPTLTVSYRAWLGMKKSQDFIGKIQANHYTRISGDYERNPDCAYCNGTLGLLKADRIE